MLENIFHPSLSSNISESLNRRDLLSRSAALGIAGQVGLLAGGVFGASPARAVLTDYTESVEYDYTDTIATWERFYIDGTQYEYMRVNGSRILLDGPNPTDPKGPYVWVDRHVWIRKVSTPNIIYGMYIRQVEGFDFRTAVFYKNLSGVNVGGERYKVTYRSLLVDTTAAKWLNSGKHRRASEINFDLPPTGVLSPQRFVSITNRYVTEEIFNGVKYRMGGTYYLRFVFRDYTNDVGWRTRSFTTVSGQDRTDIINLVNDLNVKVTAVAQGYTTAYANAGVLGGVVLAGAFASGFTSNVDDFPYWVVATGFGALVVSGVAFAYTAPATAVLAAVTASNLLITKCEQFYSQR